MTDSNDRLDRIENTLDRLESMIERMGDRAVLRNRFERIEEITAENSRFIGQLALHVDQTAESIERFAKLYDRDRRDFRKILIDHDRIIARQDKIIKLLTQEIVGERATEDESTEADES